MCYVRSKKKSDVTYKLGINKIKCLENNNTLIAVKQFIRPNAIVNILIYSYLVSNQYF